MSLDEAQFILNEPVKIGGFQVNPWTLKRFAKVYPVAKAIIERLVTAGLTFDNLETFLADRALDVLPELLPVLPELIAVSLEIPREQAEELDWATAAALTITIFGQNLAPLKNFLTLVPQVAGGAGVSTPLS